ncbi:sensor histidine kinase [Pseudoduganella armeniaca]|uniref:Sensor histidine kinase n=1 Tax=Pseudoduganella armeniaca TaxID=2072590 RepID=A0A2R4C902_9BURK|nr:histidine kinase [Pseudoduganella armeniaca]AVR96018.1 sensor histidine kinase [Pseudoduganella armeniaca]
MTPALPARRSAHWYWLCQLAGWGSVVLFNLSFVFLSHPGHAIVAVCAGGGCAGIALSHQWRRLLRGRRAAGRALTWPALAGGIGVLALLQTAAMWALFVVFQPFGQPRGFAWLPNAIIFWIGTFLAWTIFYHAVQAVRRARHAEAAALRLALAAKEAELRALQAQVNPHFFFNSLNSVRALMYEDTDAAARMIDQLADLMRYALQSGQAQTVPLAAELAAVQAYLAIEQIRFEERLRVATDIEAGLEQVAVPPMALQTLVENAVKYGVEANAAGSDIRIRAWRAGTGTHIEVANTGALAGGGGSTQVGLANARKRLALALGEQAALQLRADAGWVCATLSLPGGA